MNPKKILIFHLDDNVSDLNALKAEFAKNKTSSIFVRSFSTSSALLNALQKRPLPNIVILDIELRGKQTGIEICREIRQKYQDISVFMYSSFVDAAIIAAAQEAGADDVISKQTSHFIQADHFLQVFNEGIVESIVKNQKKLSIRDRNKKIIGPTLRRIELRLYTIIEQISRGGILITGEKGTGKSFALDLFYEALPRVSSKVRYQANGPSPLAFPDPESVAGGWFLIDGLEKLSMAQQESLLDHVGSSTKNNIRIIATCGHTMEEIKKSRAYLPDLLKYLMSNRIEIPPLRDRSAEIAEFVHHFFSKLSGGPFLVQSTVMDILCSHTYDQDNLNQLNDIIEQTKLFVTGNTITPASLPPKLLLTPVSQTRAMQTLTFTLKTKIDNISFDYLSDQLLLELISQLCELDRLNGVKTSLRRIAERIRVAPNHLKHRLHPMMAAEEIQDEAVLKLFLRK